MRFPPVLNGLIAPPIVALTLPSASLIRLPKVRIWV